jgi:hypothetical protein
MDSSILFEKDKRKSVDNDNIHFTSNDVDFLDKIKNKSNNDSYYYNYDSNPK